VSDLPSAPSATTTYPSRLVATSHKKTGPGAACDASSQARPEARSSRLVIGPS
jgi:hypothetical protein